MRFLILLFACILCTTLSAQMPVFGADSILKHYTAKADELIVGDSSLYNMFRMDIYGIKVYSKPDFETEEVPTVEYSVTWQELSTYKNVLAFESREDAMALMLEKGTRPFPPAIQKKYGNGLLSKAGFKFRTPQQPLAGLKIAIDPGHVANDTAMGHIEQKYIAINLPFPAEQIDSVPVAFAEGQLTWQTASILASRLKAAGAEVFFTRNGPGMTAFGKTFEQWKKDDYRRTLDSLLKVDPDDQNLKDLKSGKMKEDRSIFRFVFRDAELRKRSEIINAYGPDLTIVIHYNVDDTNAPWSKPSRKNFSMLFVPGSFEKDELSNAEDRFDFLRLLLTDDVEQSLEVNDFVGTQFEKKLNVPLAGLSTTGYLQMSCRKTGKRGVFARNLSMTRLVQGPIVYGETLYQDNLYEAGMLSNMSITDMQSGTTTSKRVREVAEAYYEGVLQWSYTK